MEINRLVLSLHFIKPHAFGEAFSIKKILKYVKHILGKKINNTFVMLKKYKVHIAVFTLLCLVFILIPSQSFAYLIHSTKIEHYKSNSVEKQTSSDYHQACEDESCNKCQNKDCGVACTANSCRCGNFSVISLAVPKLNGFDFNGLSLINDKQKFSYKETYFLSFFSSIWLPPKIS